MSIKRSVDYMSDIAEQAQREHDESISAKKKINNRISSVINAIESYGYQVDIEPMDDFEEKYLETLERALTRIEEAMKDISFRYHTRGKSSRALRLLHKFEPDPIWGVVVDK